MVWSPGAVREGSITCDLEVAHPRCVSIVEGAGPAVAEPHFVGPRAHRRQLAAGVRRKEIHYRSCRVLRQVLLWKSQRRKSRVSARRHGEKGYKEKERRGNESGHLCDLADHEVAQLAPPVRGTNRERNHYEEDRNETRDRTHGPLRLQSQNRALFSLFPNPLDVFI